MSAQRVWCWAASAVAFVSTTAPIVAFACPVCFAAKDEANRVAFLGTTLLLTGLPLAMMGGFIFWIARRMQAQDAQLDERPVAAMEHEARDGRAESPARGLQPIETA